MELIDELKKQIQEKEDYIDSLRKRYVDALNHGKTIEAMGIEEKGKGAKQDIELLERRVRALEYSKGIRPAVKQDSEVFTPIIYTNQLTIIEKGSESGTDTPAFKPYKDD
jgi:hypothetical protein